MSLNTSITQLVKNKNCDSIIFYDNYSFNFHKQATQLMNDNPFAGLAIRCLIPAACAAPIATTHVLLKSPPLYGELEFAINCRYKLCNQPAMFHCWLPLGNKIIDLCDVILTGGERAYATLLEKYLLESEQEVDLFSTTFYSELAKTIIAKHHLRCALVLPFCTTDIEHHSYAAEISAGSIVMLASSDPYIDKYLAAKLMQKDPLLNLHIPQIDIFSPSYKNEDVVLSQNKILLLLAEELIDHCHAKEQDGKQAYIKLSGDGSCGVSNIDPREYPEIYTGEVSARKQALHNLLNTVFGSFEVVPTSSIVEDFIEVKIDEFGPVECIASGFFDGENFQLWSITRAIVSKKGQYYGCFGSSNSEKLGLTRQDLEQLQNIMLKSANIMKQNGYHSGYISKDLMLDKNTNKFVMHDHNDRRGGRSVVEQLLPVYPDDFIISLSHRFPKYKKISLSFAGLLEPALTVSGSNTLMINDGKDFSTVSLVHKIGSKKEMLRIIDKYKKEKI